MPPLDLGAMACGDGVAFENALFDDSDTEDEVRGGDDPYAPAQSLRLRIGEDIDWCDVGVVAVLQRDDSTKGAGANPKSAARRSVAQLAAPRSSMSSASAAAPRKAAAAVVIGGLPQPGKAGRERRCSPCRLGGRARVFAAGEQGAAGHDLVEPGSPKVSCLGAVRPERRPAARGMSRRAWWPWLPAGVTCCFSSRRCARRAPRGSEADD